jgi:phage gpG-like protein
MADDDIEFDTKELTKALEALSDGFENSEATMQIAADMLVAEVHDRWQSAGDGSWPPLAASTLAKRRGSSAQILIDTGRAFASVHAAHGKDFAEANTDTSYMKYHCGDGPHAKIPKRDPFELSDEARERIQDFVLEDLLRRWAAAKGGSGS